MQQIDVPPQSQKPLDPSGYFSTIWHRFFLKMHAQMNKTNEVETTVNFSSSSQDGAGSNSELSKKIEELETRLLFLDSQKDISQRLDDVELALLFSGSNSGLATAEHIKKLNNLSASGVVPYKIEDGETVQVNDYEYLSVEFTGEYIIEGTGSLELNGNSFLSVVGGGI
jgi:hypothetical protein